MVLLETSVEVIVVVISWLVRKRNRLRMLFQLRHVLCGVPSLECGEVTGALVLALPQQVLPKRFGELR